MGSIIVKNSLIHGIGVYATTEIKKSDIVIHWKNTRALTQEEFNSLPLEEHAYIEKTDGKIFLMGKPERYVNHSCDPNTTPGDQCDIANRDIKTGEEITTDYANFHIPDHVIQCKCLSINCKKIITGKKV